MTLGKIGEIVEHVAEKIPHFTTNVAELKRENEALRAALQTSQARNRELLSTLKQIADLVDTA